MMCKRVVLPGGFTCLSAGELRQAIKKQLCRCHPILQADPDIEIEDKECLCNVDIVKTLRLIGVEFDFDDEFGEYIIKRWPSQSLAVKVTCWYRKNLRMSPGKLAAQVGHAIANLHLPSPPERIIVLSASDNKFDSLKSSASYIVRDSGFTEVKPGSETVLAISEPVPAEMSPIESDLRDRLNNDAIVD